MSEKLNLKPEVIAWLNDIRPEEIDTHREMIGMVNAMGLGIPKVGLERIRAAILMADRLESMKKIMQTLIIAGVGALAAIAAIPDQLKSILSWLSRLGGAK